MARRSRRRADTSKRSAVLKHSVQTPIIPWLTRRQVQVLRRAGVSPTKTAELTGISRRSVGRIAAEATLSSAAARAGQGEGAIRLDRRRRRGQQEPMFSQIKRAEVQVLRRAGVSRTKVRALTGVSVRSVRRIEKEKSVTHADDRAAHKEQRIGRPSKAEPFRAFVASVLKDEPELMSLELLRRAKLEGYTGSKTAFYTLVASERPAKQRPVVRFEGLPGEFSQHDFGEVDVRFMNGTRRHVHFFASRLKYSRWAQVTLVQDQTVESLVRPLVEHFDAMGGVPLVAVFDRPTTVVLRSTHREDGQGQTHEYNPTFAAVMLELGVGIELCWPRSGNQKGSVERIVGWVKNSFFKQRRFLDEADLRRQLAEWHDEINTRVISRATGVTHAARIVEERVRMRPLQVQPNELALRIPIVVGPTGMVLHDTHLYSMSPDAIGIAGTLYLHKDKVRIVAGRFCSHHERLFVPHAKSILPEHRAEMAAAVSGKRAKRYYKREQLLGLGNVAFDYLTELVHRKPKTWPDDVEALFDLLQMYGDAATRHAIEIALGEKIFGAEYVAHFLHDRALAIGRLGTAEVST
jgi:transposase